MSRKKPTPDEDLFALRLQRSAPDLWPMLEALYGHLPTYAVFRVDLLAALEHGWTDRPAPLKRLDLQRDLEPDWFARPTMAG